MIKKRTKLKVKRIISLVLAVLITISFVGCCFNITKAEDNTVEVYITVTDISDYAKPLNVVVPRRLVSVPYFNLADVGNDSLKFITAVEGVTYLHALVQLHRDIFGEGGEELIQLDQYGNTVRFLNTATANTMYKNGRDIFAYPQMINIKDGDEIQVCLYDKGRSQAIATFMESRIDDVAIGEEIDVTLLQHYGFPRYSDPIPQAELCDENGLYITDSSGEIIVTDSDGNATLSFNEAGTYTVSVMPEINYYMNEEGGSQWELVERWETITVEIPHTKKVGQRDYFVDSLAESNSWLQDVWDNPPSDLTESEDSGNIAVDKSFTWLLTWDNEPFDEELSTSDTAYISETVDQRPPEYSGELMIKSEDIVDNTPVIRTETVKVEEWVEVIVSADLKPMVTYTTPLITINVSEDFMLTNSRIVTENNTKKVRFDTKNASLVDEGYQCFVAVYDADNRLLDVTEVTNIQAKNNTVILPDTFDHIKIMAWKSGMQPICEAELVTEDTVAEDLDWNYLMPNPDNTYITLPTE